MINSVVLVGRLTKDVQVRKTTGGVSKSEFTVACDRIGNGTDFISCVAWRQPADFIGLYGKKGSLVGVKGSITTRSYEKDGVRRYVTEVTADDVKLFPRSNEGTPAETETAPETPENEFEDLLPF